MLEKYMTWLLKKLKKPNQSRAYMMVFVIISGLSLLAWAVFSKEAREFLASQEDEK